MLITDQEIARLQEFIKPGQIWWTWNEFRPAYFRVLCSENGRPDDTYFYVTRMFGRTPERWYISRFLDATTSQTEAYQNCIAEHIRQAKFLRKQLAEINSRTTETPDNDTNPAETI